MKKIKTIPFTAIFFCSHRFVFGMRRPSIFRLGNDSIFERAFSEVLDNHHFCLRR